MKYFWRNAYREKMRTYPGTKYLVDKNGKIVVFVFCRGGFYFRSETIVSGDILSSHETEKSAMSEEEERLLCTDGASLEIIDQTKNQEPEK